MWAGFFPGDIRIPLIPRPVPHEGWQIIERFPAVAAFGNPGSEPVLLRSRISSNAADDVMVLDASTRQITVISHANMDPGAARFVPGEVSVRPYSGAPTNAIVHARERGWSARG